MQGIQTGMGQGLSQIIDTKWYTGQVLRQKELNDAKERQQSQEIASMLSKYDPKGMRGVDKTEFYQKYNELKSLYLTNKGLYSKPADHPEAYHKALELEQDLNGRITDSEDTKKFLYDSGKDMAQHWDDYEENAHTTWSEWNNMSTSEMKKKYGRLPDHTDIAYAPKEIKYDDISKEIKSFGKGKMIPSYTDGNGQNGIKEGQMKVDTHRVEDPDVIGAVAEKWWLNGNFKRFYTKAFKELPEDRIMETQNTLNETLGTDKTFRIEDPKSFAKADLIIRNNKTLEKYEIKDNPDWKDKKEQDRFDRGFNKQLYMQQRGFDHSDQSQARNLQAQLERDTIKAKDKSAVDNKLDVDLENINQAAQSGDATKLGELVNVLFEAGDKYLKKPNVFSPKDAKSLDTFLKIIKLSNTGLDNGTSEDKEKSEMFKITEEEAKVMYDRNIPLIQVTRKIKNPNGTIRGQSRLFNPAMTSFKRLLKSELLDATEASRKHGTDQPSDTD